MIFRQFINDDLGCASYLVGDEHAGVAAVVDPRLEVDEYLRVARFMGVDIAHILETHTHADHVSGHGRLAEATGATIHVNRVARADYPHDPIDDGWELDLGDVRIRALHTPGHRPEHTCFALTDTVARRGALGRPDRRLAVRGRRGAARPGGRAARGRARHLPEPPRRAARPAAGGRGVAGPPGRIDVRRAGHEPQDQLDDRLRAGQQRPPRRPGGGGRFVARSLADIGPQPPNFREIVEINRGPLASLDVPDRPLTPGQVHGPPGRRRAGGGRPHGPAVRRRPRPRGHLGHRPARRLRHPAGVAGRRPAARSSWWAATTRRPARPRGWRRRSASAAAAATCRAA